MHARGTVPTAPREPGITIKHVGLIVEVEHEFGVRFNVGEANAMRNVGEMADMVVGKLG